MNHFIDLKLTDGTSVLVRPEAILAVEDHNGNDYIIVRTSVNTYEVLRGQFTLSTLVNRTSHAGVRALG